MAKATVRQKALRWAVIAIVTTGVAGLVSVVIAYYGAPVFRTFSGVLP